MRYLGVDYGLKKIGLAISEGSLASLYGVLDTQSLEEALNKIRGVIKKEEIERLVIGIPESGENKKGVYSFIRRIKNEVEVIEVEETLSSVKALELMKELGVSKKERQREDAYAAVLILQNFLDSLN